MKKYEAPEVQEYGSVESLTLEEKCGDGEDEEFGVQIDLKFQSCVPG